MRRRKAAAVGVHGTAFEVWSTRLTGVDQISEGEIIQGRRRGSKQSLLRGLPSPTDAVSQFFLFDLSVRWSYLSLSLFFVRSRLVPSSGLVSADFRAHSERGIRPVRTESSQIMTEFRVDGRIRAVWRG